VAASMRAGQDSKKNPSQVRSVSTYLVSTWPRRSCEVCRALSTTLEAPGLPGARAHGQSPRQQRPRCAAQRRGRTPAAATRGADGPGPSSRGSCALTPCQTTSPTRRTAELGRGKRNAGKTLVHTAVAKGGGRSSARGRRRRSTEAQPSVLAKLRARMGQPHSSFILPCKVFECAAVWGNF
jgi:hypothetical protein